MDNYFSLLSEMEKQELEKYTNIIVWGFPLHTHTHSYIHAMWVKVFKECFNKSVCWFHDDDFPNDFDYGNCLFITEGYCDSKIPIVESSVYFVHNAISPEKYLATGARLIEIRFNVIEIHDVNNDFNLQDGTHEQMVFLSEETKYEKLSSNKDIYFKKRNHTITPMNYECVYLYWATDLLPHEFNANNIYTTPENKIYYIGSPTHSQDLHFFKHISEKHGIQWVSVNPWNTPISFEDNKTLMHKSLLCPDFRPSGSSQDEQEFGIKNGKNHLAIGYLPCRVLKAISYGKLGITNSIHVKDILKEHVVYSNDMNKLFQMSIEKRNDYTHLLQSMEYVKDRHTYFHRARDLIRALLQ